MRIANNEKKEGIIRCFIDFPLFDGDFNILFSEGIIRHIAFDRYEWTKSKTSLAEYFNWIGKDASCVEGGFWAPIAKTFTVKGKRTTKRQLSKLAGNNANNLKPEKSKDFIMIENLVSQYREKIKEQAEQDRKDREAFVAIKELIDKAEGKDIKKIRTSLKKIKTILI